MKKTIAAATVLLLLTGCSATPSGSESSAASKPSTTSSTDTSSAATDSVTESTTQSSATTSRSADSETASETSASAASAQPSVEITNKAGGEFMTTPMGQPMEYTMMTFETIESEPTMVPFQVTITQTKCGMTQLPYAVQNPAVLQGDANAAPYIPLEADEGKQICGVDLTLKNIGDRPSKYEPVGDLYTTAGKAYRNDEDAARFYYDNSGHSAKDKETWASGPDPEVDTDSEIHQFAVYQIPLDARPYGLEYPESQDSGEGAALNLLLTQ